MTGPVPGGFEPPPYPQDRLGELKATASAVPGGLVDCSVGTPVDPMPEVVLDALVAAAPGATGYPQSIGSPAFREAASGWMLRRFALDVSPDDVVACVGTKELVASLPHHLSLRDPSRDTVLYPAISYPTYEMGARLAGLRAVPVPLDERWMPDLDRVRDADGARALILWVNHPGNPTGSSCRSEALRPVVEWARRRGVIVASDECYVEFSWDEHGRPTPPASALTAGNDGVLAVHSLSKRSNMAGLRAGFVCGDPELVHYLGEVRRHAGLMMPAPVQAAAAAALGDDVHVDEQRARYARRRVLAADALADAGFVHDGGSSTFYLWLRAAEGHADGWDLARRLARAGILAAPGDLYGMDGRDHVRLSLTVTDDQLALALGRLADTEKEKS